jgi:hypothetical protein
MRRADRAAAIRKAFDTTVKDPAFLEETRKLGLEIEPMNWEDLTKAVNDTINQPPEAIDKARAGIQPPYRGRLTYLCGSAQAKRLCAARMPHGRKAFGGPVQGKAQCSRSRFL